MVHFTVWALDTCKTVPHGIRVTVLYACPVEVAEAPLNRALQRSSSSR